MYCFANISNGEFDWLCRVNPYGLHFGQIKVSDLILVDHEGKIAYGGRAVNKAAFMIHYNVHEAREDAVCAVHR